jgi:Mce-associated membrane protein
VTTPAHQPDNPAEKEAPAVPVDIETTVDENVQPEETAPAAEVSDSDAVELSAEVADPQAGSSAAKILAFGVLPAIALILAATAGYLKWVDNSVRLADVARVESTQAAKDATVKLLSYKPDTVEQDLGAARDLLTGEFRDSYTKLTTDVVIPGSKEKQISAVANVPAVASISANPNRAEALVFVNQTVIVGSGAPTGTASSVKVTLDKVGDRWLISAFDPV